MKKKFHLIVVFLMLVVFTGCTPEYNLEVKDNMISEELVVTDFTEQQKAAFFVPRYSKTDNSSNYQMNSNDNKLSYSYKFSFKNYLNSNMAKNCYDALLLYEEDDHYVLHTGSEFKCLPFQVNDNILLTYDNLKINIKFTDYTVLENNADEVNNNIYTWNIDKTNYKNKPILIKFKSNKKQEVTKKNKNNTSTIFMIVIGSVIVLLLAGVLYISAVNNKKNKI